MIPLLSAVWVLSFALIFVGFRALSDAELKKSRFPHYPLAIACLFLGSAGLIYLFHSVFHLRTLWVVCSLFYLGQLTHYVWLINKKYQVRQTPKNASPTQPHPIEQQIAPVRESAHETLEVLLNKWLDEKQYLNSDITLDSLSAELKTNRTYLSTYINKKTDKTFRVWICELRIQEAQRLMTVQPDLSLLAIAEQVGIPDKSSFYRQFNKATGMTPGEFRKTF